ncbi:MAG TPA: J domain-containing protein [Oculatellaceae cyanobacterium]
MALGDRISRIVRANCNDMTGKLDPVEGAGFIATGAATGAGVSATVGGMGLVGGFGGIGIGMAPVAAAGAIANPDDVKSAYRRLAWQYHPDINRCTSAIAKMQAINKAYEEFLKKFGKAWFS